MEQRTAESLSDEFIVLRYFVTQLSATLFGSIGGTRDKFDEFSEHVRSSFGIKPGSENAPGAEVAAAAIPGMLEKLDRLMAEVRHLLPK